MKTSGAERERERERTLYKKERNILMVRGREKKRNAPVGGDGEVIGEGEVWGSGGGRGEQGREDRAQEIQEWDCDRME